MRSPKPSKLPTVLIVDDDHVMRMLEQETLVQFDFEVVEAADGEQALELLVEPPPDLVLLDVDMPGVDGFEVCRRIRRSWDAAEVPVIMVTGMDDLASINQAYEAGANDFISKPINWPILGYRARYVLRSAQAARTLRELEEKQAAIVRAMPDMIFLVDRDGTFLDYKEGYGTTPYTPPATSSGARCPRYCRPMSARPCCIAWSVRWTRGICSPWCTSCRCPTAPTTMKHASHAADRTKLPSWCATSRCRS